MRADLPRSGVNISISLKFSCVTLQPRLELLRGPPTHCGSSPRNPQSFRLLPLAVSAGGDPLSPRWAKYLSVECGGRVSGKESRMACSLTFIHVKIPFYDHVQQPKNVKFAGASFEDPQEPVLGAVRMTLQKNALGSPLSGM